MIPQPFKPAGAQLRDCQRYHADDLASTRRVRHFRLRTCQRYHVNTLDDALYAKTLDAQLGITHQWPQELWSPK